MNEYIPSPTQWVAKQVEEYEGSGGTDGTTLLGPDGYNGPPGLPVIIVTNQGWKTGAIRKTPLMRVVDGNSYVLVASIGGAPKNPLWVYNLRADPNVTIRDGVEVYSMKVREVKDSAEKQRLWNISVEAFPPYEDYQKKTKRIIPVFVAEPIK